MRKHISLAALMLCIVLLAGCTSHPEDAAVTRVVFERGHGSAWGNQFFIDVCPQQITKCQFIPAGTGTLQTGEKIPIAPSQWQQLTDMLEGMTLQPEKENLFQRLFGGRKLDGGAFRKLTLYRGEHATVYRWPDNGAALEEFLEALGGAAGQ